MSCELVTLSWQGSLPAGGICNGSGERPVLLQTQVDNRARSEQQKPHNCGATLETNGGPILLSQMVH
jgi:hypothetical protein